jgi:hypothetical protein
MKPTIVIGLLGGGKHSKEMEGGLLDEMGECPLATQDEIVNKGNKQKAILTASYGPSDGKEKCGNCEYGMKLKGCGLGKGEVFCDIYEFKCDAKNVCDAWESMEEGEDDAERE